MKSPGISVTRSFLVALALGMVVAPAVRAGEIVWKSDFSTLPVGPAEEFGPEAAIVEEGGQHLLSQKSAEQQVLFRDATGEFVEMIDYRSTVRFRSHSGTSIVVAVKFRGPGRDEAQYLWYYVTLTNDKLEVSTCHLDPADRATFLDDPRVLSSVDLATLGVVSLLPGEWITLSVDVGEAVLKARVTTESGQTGEWEFPVFAGTGGSYLLTRAPADIGEFVIEQLPEPVRAAE